VNARPFDVRHLAPHLRAGGGRLREFALQSRRFPRQNREPGDLDKIFLEEAPYADQFALDQLDLLGLGLLQGGVAAEFVVELSDTLTELGFLAPARRTPQLEQFSFAVQRGGKFRRWRIFQKSSGTTMCSAPSRSLASRAFLARISSRPLVTMARPARKTVSSS